MKKLTDNNKTVYHSLCSSGKYPAANKFLRHLIYGRKAISLSMSDTDWYIQMELDKVNTPYVITRSGYFSVYSLIY